MYVAQVPFRPGIITWLRLLLVFALHGVSSTKTKIFPNFNSTRIDDPPAWKLAQADVTSFLIWQRSKQMFRNFGIVSILSKNASMAVWR